METTVKIYREGESDEEIIAYVERWEEMLRSDGQDPDEIRFMVVKDIPPDVKPPVITRQIVEHCFMRIKELLSDPRFDDAVWKVKMYEFMTTITTYWDKHRDE